jgi:hypothetical protein
MRSVSQSEQNDEPCYTEFALSDLVVSGALPLKATLPCTDFPKPLQRNPLSFHPGHSVPDSFKDQESGAASPLQSGLAAASGQRIYCAIKGCRSATCRLAIRSAWVSSGPRAFLKMLAASPRDVFGSSLRKIFLRSLAPFDGPVRFLCPAPFAGPHEISGSRRP